MTNGVQRAAGPRDLLRSGDLRRWRRRFVKQTGKRSIRRMSAFIGGQSLVGAQPVLDTAAFDWAARLEAATPSIRQELERILVWRDALPAFHEVSPDQRRISTGDDWKTFILFGFGYKSNANCALCPQTTAALERLPGLRTAFFSILAPGARIPAHRGVTRGLLRAHLPLVTPANAENCWMRVGDARIVWREGELVVFDDTYEHEVRNDTSEARVVLLIDVDRPMRFWGRALHRAFLAGIRSSAYVQDARRNLRQSEARLQTAMHGAGSPESAEGRRR